MPDSLSPREIECVRLAGTGLEDKEIASELGISPRTVSNHLHRAYAKLQVSDRKLAARKLSIFYSELPLLIPEAAAVALDTDASAWVPSEAQATQETTNWPFPPPPSGTFGRIVTILISATFALLLAIGIITVGMVVPTLFDRIAPEWAH